MVSIPVQLLMAAIFGLIVGPLLLHNKKDPQKWHSLLDGFTIVSVGGLAALHLLPEGISQGGWMAVLAAIIGMAFPVVLERSASRNSGHAEAIFLLIALIPHAVMESAALGAASEERTLALGSAIAAHRLSVGLIIFSMFQHRYSTRGGWGSIGVLILATLAGFWAGDHISFTNEGFAWMEAFVGGMLLHVVYSHHLHEGCEHNPAPVCVHDHHEHHHHDQAHGHDHDHAHDHDHHHHHAEHHHHDHGDSTAKATNFWPALGALIGAGIVALVLIFSKGHSHSHDHGHDHQHLGHDTSFLDTFMSLALESAPALLLAYILAGLVQVFLTPARTRWMHGGGNSSQALKGVAFGLPLPICSCGVLPLYQTLVKMGVPATAAMGFLIATPELGIDAILLSIPLLGMELTLARLAAAFAVAMGVAIIIGRLIPTPDVEVRPEVTQEKAPLNERLKSGFDFGLKELFDHTMPWVLIGLLIAGLAEPVLGDESLRSLPPELQVPLFGLLGIPVYVCASGATPIAAVAVFQGVSPGAALAFLLAGPATNITTFGILSQLHGKKIAIGFGVAVWLSAVISGIVVDQMTIETLETSQTSLHQDGSILQWLSFCGLGFLLFSSLFRQGPRGLMIQITNPNHEH